MTPRRASSSASARGSWSMPSASGAPRRRRRRARPRGRPAARRAARSAGRAGPGRAPRGAAIAVASRAPPPSAVSASRSVAAPRAIASPCWAAVSRARISSASPGRRLRGGDLVGLVLEQRRAGAPPRAGRAPRHRAAPGSRASARRPRPSPSRSVLVAAERVEQVALPALVEQPPLVVLAVDLDERPDLVGQAGGGHRRVVEARRRAAGRGRPRGPRSAAPAAGRTAPRPARASAPCRTSVVSARAPERQPEGIDQQALAGAGLAGDDVQAGRRTPGAAGRSGRGR